jgi:integrase
VKDSTAKSNARRPRKAIKLSFHKGTGYWYKTIRGRRKYYEHVDNDPTGQKSLEQWLSQKDDPFAPPKRVESGEITLLEVCDKFCRFKKDRLETGELSQRMFDEYHATCALVLTEIDKDRKAVNLDSTDFANIRRALSKRYGVNGLAKRIQQVRSLFKYAYESEMLDKPVRFGPSFKKPSAKKMREHEIKKGAQDFSADEIRRMLANATPITRAMVLLGCNGALGNSDIADLPFAAIDLKKGWLDYPRAKTATRRRIPLWPETIESLKAVIEKRPKTDSQMLFVSVRGQDFTDETRTGWRVTGYFRQVLKKIGITDGRGFYGLRRTFQTQAEESGDLVAVQSIMGHIPSERDMSARYRQRISDARLQSVVEVVRQWLLPLEIVEVTK